MSDIDTKLAIGGYTVLRWPKDGENNETPSEAVIEAVNLMGGLTDDERMEVMSHFCRHCGCKNPSCQCSNDE